MEGYSLKEDLLEMFHRGVHLLHRSGPHLRRHGRQSTMPPAQGRLMRLLATTGPVAQRTLGDILDIRSASLSELLTKLDKSGWIRRRPSETDKRTMDIELTEEGEKMLSSIGNERAVMAEEVFGALDEEELRQLHGLLGKLIGDWETRFESDGHHFGRGRPGHGEGRFEHGPGWFERLRGKFHHHHCSRHHHGSEDGEHQSPKHVRHHGSEHDHHRRSDHRPGPAEAEKCTRPEDKPAETD